jgi:hypothetical protein
LHKKFLFVALAVFSIVILVVAATLVYIYLPIGTNQTPLLFNVQTYDSNAAWNGNITFGLIRYNENFTQPLNSTLIIMDTNGTIYYTRQSQGGNYWTAKNLDPYVLMFQGEPSQLIGNDPVSATHFWNFSQNTTVNYPNVLSHHDIQYNPVNNTFLTLQPELKTVKNETVLYDKIEILSSTGQVLWTWDTYDYIPLTEAGPYNVTVTVNSTSIYDFTHANAIGWDYNQGIIYLNLRHTNTFYKINQTDGKIIWACGEYGNFTLLTQKGTQTKSLWYHSHDLKQVAPNEFMMFDNDYTNETNLHNCRSRMLKISLNETSMTAQETWSWEGPKSWYSPYLGSVDILPNGNVMGCFGTPTHQFPENKPWDFDNTGAIIAEVTPQGQLVRTITFPVGLQIYRVQLIHNWSS